MSKSKPHRYRRPFKRPPAGTFEAKIFDLSHDGRGITHVDGKIVFIEGALPTEHVSFEYLKTHEAYDEAKVVSIQKVSESRIEPVCEYFNACGGCSLQHLHPDQQIVFKQSQMLGNLKKQAKIEPLEVLEPLRSKSEGYRYKGRLGVKNVAAKGRVLVGFRERHSPYLTNMKSCVVLDPRIGLKLDDISLLIGQLSIVNSIPQIEVAASESQVALSFRVMEPPTEADIEHLKSFGKTHNIQIYLQPKSETSTYGLSDDALSEDALRYTLLDDVQLAFKPYHFTQVNPAMNQAMIVQAMALLDLKKDETVLDLFCGLGNFTLAMGKYAQKVIGVEGDHSLVEFAQKNAARNSMDHVEFHCANLDEVEEDAPWLNTKYDAVLIDPSRKGAYRMMAHIGKLSPSRILYVSCHPATLARDLAVLVDQYGYVLEKAGVMDMFPHTAHVESMALLVKKSGKK